MFKQVLIQAVAEGETAVRALGEGTTTVSDPVLELHLAIARAVMADPEVLRRLPQMREKTSRDNE